MSPWLKIEHSSFRAALLSKEGWNTGTGVEVQLLGQLQQVLDADALVGHLLHRVELVLHGQVETVNHLKRREGLLSQMPTGRERNLSTLIETWISQLRQANKKFNFFKPWTELLRVSSDPEKIHGNPLFWTASLYFALGTLGQERIVGIEHRAVPIHNLPSSTSIRR